MQATETTAVVHGMLDPLRGSTPPQPVKCYELTEDGKKYFEQIPGTLGQTSGFCFVQKSVDSIVKWTEPTTVGSSSQTTLLGNWGVQTGAQLASLICILQILKRSLGIIRAMLSLLESIHNRPSCLRFPYHRPSSRRRPKNDSSALQDS